MLQGECENAGLIRRLGCEVWASLLGVIWGVLVVFLMRFFWPFWAVFGGLHTRWKRVDSGLETRRIDRGKAAILGWKGGYSDCFRGMNAGNLSRF